MKPNMMPSVLLLFPNKAPSPLLNALTPQIITWIVRQEGSWSHVVCVGGTCLGLSLGIPFWLLGSYSVSVHSRCSMYALQNLIK